MGNTSSEAVEEDSIEKDLWWSNGSVTQTKTQLNQEFTEEINAIRQRRSEIIQTKKKEMDELRKENEELKELLRQKEVPAENHEKIKEQMETLKCQVVELHKQLEEAHSVFNSERLEYKNHVKALKDVIAVSKKLVLIRDEENKQLSAKVAEIQSTLPQQELETFAEDVRKEYDRQLKNMKQLKVLYEEKQKVDKAECNRLKRLLDNTSLTLQTQEVKNKELEERVTELEESNSTKYDSIRSLESQFGLSKAECAELHAEMTVINQLFSQILMGFNNGLEIDLDNLIKILEENHDLLKDIVVKGECSVMSSALPKVLLDLIQQVNEKDKQEININQTDLEPQTTSQQNTISSVAEIVENLPKVWRVLIELLSHQRTFKNESTEEFDKNPCYKSVETPTGPTLVLSVSKTFIRLKDLIVEKKSLEKETTRLKQLNTHLEGRLQDQEKRLEEVSHELSNTWHVVGKMQKQHQQLHTHEKILRYELSQKRKLLNELKEELEYCKEKCLQAHEKNSSTTELWTQLRSEFALRRVGIVSDDVNNSIESGYSDDRESSSDDDYTEPAGATILEVIQDEIVKIECSTENSDKQLEVDVPDTIKQPDEETRTQPCKAPKEILAGREDRLKRLEEQAQELLGKVQKNANRGTEFCKVLNDLHDRYGSTKEDLDQTQEKGDQGNSSCDPS